MPSFNSCSQRFYSSSYCLNNVLNNTKNKNVSSSTLTKWDDDKQRCKIITTDKGIFIKFI